MAILFFIIGIILFIGLVVVHEMGHFFAARRNGVEVEEFGIGFPPRAKILSVKKGTTYTLNWLPLGGFVKLKGEHDSDTAPGSYGAAPLGVKMKILLAGVFMNLVAASVLFTIIALVGMPKGNLDRLPFYDKQQFTVAADETTVKKDIFVAVAEQSPAAKAGIESGDEILRIGEKEIKDDSEVNPTVEGYAGQTVDIMVVKESGEEATYAVPINQEFEYATNEEGERYAVGRLGVSAYDSETFRSTWSAPIVGIGSTLQYADVSLRGLGYVVQNLFAGQTEQATDAIGGPVATFKILSDTSSLGIVYVLFVIALISVSLAIMNILPIPALDGGRAFVTLLFRIARKPLKKDLEELIHGAGFAFLMLLIVAITVVDVRRFF